MEFQSPMEFINYVCSEFGPRISGSGGEYRAGEFIYQEMKKFADEVEKEFYISHPAGFLDFIWFTVAFYILGVLLYFFGIFILVPFFIFLALLIYIIQQNLLLEIVDIFFPSVKEFHVIGKIKPRKEAKNLVLLSAHYDSAYEFPILGRYRKKGLQFLNITVYVAIITFILSILRIFFNYAVIDYLQYFLLTVGSFLILVMGLGLRSREGVIGANDDLAAVASIIWAGKALHEERPENTEVWILAVAGEEHMRGTKRFVKNHLKELKERKALDFNLETPSGDYFLITTGEKMFLSKHSKKCVEIFEKSASMANVEYKIGELPFLGSDASNFSRNGIDSSTLFGLCKNDDMPCFWHVKEDTPEKLKHEMIDKSIEILLNAVKIVDKG